MTIKSVGEWQINHVVAERYRQGRVFLAGDAAHRHPPADGLGSNASVQDAYNLAWKLSMVLSGQAGDHLLDSYHDERQSVGKQVVDRAMKSVADMLPIFTALGFQPDQSMDEGWAVLNELAEASAAGAQRRRQLQSAVDLQNFFWYLKDPAGNFSEYYSDLDCVLDDHRWTPETFGRGTGCCCRAPRACSTGVRRRRHRFSPRTTLPPL